MGTGPPAGLVLWEKSTQASLTGKSCLLTAAASSWVFSAITSQRSGFPFQSLGPSVSHSTPYSFAPTAHVDPKQDVYLLILELQIIRTSKIICSNLKWGNSPKKANNSKNFLYISYIYMILEITSGPRSFNNSKDLQYHLLSVRHCSKYFMIFSLHPKTQEKEVMKRVTQSHSINW